MEILRTEGLTKYYEGPDSLRAKCEYLTAKGLLGIMYWEHGCDSTHTLLKSIADALER